MEKKVLITGANGFIGRFLGHYLAQYRDHHYSIVHALRNSASEQGHLAQGRVEWIGDLDSDTDWSQSLARVDCVIHLAARVHVMQESESDPLRAFQAVNYHATMNLAQQAIEAGVKRFIYLSTIKVNGEHTDSTPFYADDSVAELSEPYAISKQQAEQGLLSLQQQGLLEVVIIRPPLVYGPGVKGNFYRLIRLVEKQLPLPLAGINNRRSLVSINNLSALIQTCIEHPRAAGEIFLASDGNDLSSSELFNQLAQALGCRNRLFYLPRGIIQLATQLLGKSKEFERLFGSLQVDIKKNREVLQWRPDTSIEQSLKQTISDYLQEKHDS